MRISPEFASDLAGLARFKERLRNPKVSVWRRIWWAIRSLRAKAQP